MFLNDDIEKGKGEEKGLTKLEAVLMVGMMCLAGGVFIGNKVTESNMLSAIEEGKLGKTSYDACPELVKILEENNIRATWNSYGINISGLEEYDGKGRISEEDGK